LGFDFFIIYEFDMIYRRRSTESKTKNKEGGSSMNNNVGKWLGWIGIVVGVIGFFWLRIWLGVAAVILGVIGMFSPQKKLNVVTIVAGIIAIILGIIL